MDRRRLHLTSPKLIQMVKDLHEYIKEQVGDADRANFVEESDNISEAGIAAELVMLIWLARDIDDLRRLLDLWKAASRLGKNYGRDLLKEWFNLSFDLEVKCSPVPPTSNTGILFMRTPSAHRYPKGINHLSDLYWRRTLPEAYYILLHQVHKDNNFEFELVGWTTKDRFIDLYEPYSQDRERQLGPGYPTICMHWHNLYCPDEFVKAVKEGRDPQRTLLCPNLALPVIPYKSKRPLLHYLSNGVV